MSIAADQAARPPTSAALTPFGKTTPLAITSGVSNNPNLQREVFGFVNAGNLGSAYVGYTTWNLSLLSTVAYFGLQVNSGDGNFVTTNTGWAVYHSSTMSSFVNAAHAQHVRVIVSINLHDFGTGPNNQTCLGLQSSSAQNTINQAVAQMQWAGIDGINVDYEGTITTCADGISNRQELVSFVQGLRAKMPTGTYLAIDTFSGAAEDNQEFFDITGIAPYVDSFFVMAYDMDEANYFESPLNCSSYCFNPVSPLNTYRFNITTSLQQYTALVPASKVILGQPWYGRSGCVPNLTTAHQHPTGSFGATTYQYAAYTPLSHGVSSFSRHRDPSDLTSEWDTWYDSDFICNREQYWDDVDSFAGKYRTILQSGIRGLGVFTLDYGGGAPELWSEINTYFSCPAAVSLPDTQSTTEFTFGLSAGSCSVARFDVQAYDSTLNRGWYTLAASAAVAGSANVVADGYPGYTYAYRARAHSTAGVIGAWSPVVSTTVSATATRSHPFSGMYTLEAYGGVNAASSPPLSGSAYWWGWQIARVAHFQPGTNAPQSGFVLDGWGGLHAYGAPGLSETSGALGHYWSGWDIARDFAFLPDGTGGFVLDGYGGLHAFRVNGATGPLQAVGNAYWPGWDIARKVVIFADGSGGYTLDGWGGIHPFGINRAAPVAASQIAQTGYWPGWSIARDIVLVPGDGGHSGYTLDGWGGVHAFHVNGDGSTMPGPIAVSGYWRGWDIARGLWLLPGSAGAGYTLDGWGGLHPFGGAPPIANSPYWSGHDIARNVWGA